jgi:hypothetical protein
VGSGALNAVNKVGTFCGIYVMLLKYFFISVSSMQYCL